MSVNLLIPSILDASLTQKVALATTKNIVSKYILWQTWLFPTYTWYLSAMKHIESLTALHKMSAGMAEQVDAPDSKSGSGNRVRVRFSLPAPYFWAVPMYSFLNFTQEQNLRNCMPTLLLLYLIS